MNSVFALIVFFMAGTACADEAPALINDADLAGYIEGYVDGVLEDVVYVIANNGAVEVR